MLNIRDTLLSYFGNLTISGIQSYKDGINTDLVVNANKEAMVYTSGMLAIGDSYFITEPYARNNEKITYFVDLIVLSKLPTIVNPENVANLLVTAMHNSTLNNSQVLSCKIVQSEPTEKHAIGQLYKILRAEILTLQNVPSYCPLDVQITYVDYSLSFVGGIAPFVATGTFSPTDVASFTYVIDSVKSGTHTYYSGVVSYNTSTWDIGSTIQLQSEYTNTLTVTLTTTYGAVVTDSLAINFSA